MDSFVLPCRIACPQYWLLWVCFCRLVSLYQLLTSLVEGARELTIFRISLEAYGAKVTQISAPIGGVATYVCLI